MVEKAPKQKNIISIAGKEIDDEGYIKSCEFWTKEDGSIRMNIAEGFSWENLVVLCKSVVKEAEEYIGEKIPLK